jgi:hypothetical protein
MRLSRRTRSSGVARRRMAIPLTVAGPRASSFKRLASSVIAASLRPPREDRVTVNSPRPYRSPPYRSRAVRHAGRVLINFPHTRRSASDFHEGGEVSALGESTALSQTDAEYSRLSSKCPFGSFQVPRDRMHHKLAHPIICPSDPVTTGHSFGHLLPKPDRPIVDRLGGVLPSQ